MKIKISEIFESLQGEGKFAGTPMLFIRTSGCTRKCSFCDTQYHTEGRDMTLTDLLARIKKSKLDYICWTGGEPLIWRKEIAWIMDKTPNLKHHVETNGDLLSEIMEDSMFVKFSYISVSPKERKIALSSRRFLERALDRGELNTADIKVVTDLDKVNKDLVPYASILMPLSTFDVALDNAIYKKVWEYCVKNNIRFTPRLHTAFGKRKGI